MKTLKHSLLSFAGLLDGLKRGRKTIAALIMLDLVMAMGSIAWDWSWFVRVEWYLKPFTPICSLYPLLLLVWFVNYYRNKKNPDWFTAFIFTGVVSYGLMAWIYFPGYMSYYGFDLMGFGNLAWVTTYFLQSLVLLSELKKLPLHQYLLIFSYFLFKDYSDRYLGTFWDNVDLYPPHLRVLFGTAIITLHVFAGSLLLYLTLRKKAYGAGVAAVSTLAPASAAAGTPELKVLE